MRSLGTIDAAIYILDVFRENMMKNKNGAAHAILFDFSAAFDTVNRRKLVDYLERVYGVKGSMLKYLKGFLFNRNTCTRANGVYSDWYNDTVGVPQ